MKNPFFLPLLWLACITGLSVMPSMKLPKFDLLAPDKLGHAVAYGLLVWLLLRAWRSTRGAAWKRAAPLLVVFAAGYGVVMEFIQGAFIPGRFYEYDDMLANAFGALAAWGLFALIYRKKMSPITNNQ